MDIYLPRRKDTAVLLQGKLKRYKVKAQNSTLSRLYNELSNVSHIEVGKTAPPSTCNLIYHYKSKCVSINIFL